MQLHEAISAAEARFEQGRKLAGAVLAPAAFALTYWLTAGRLSSDGRKVAAVAATVAVLWASEALPLPVTALLGAVLCVLLGAAEAKAVFAPFADSIVFLFIGSFLLAKAMTRHGLDRRFALAFLCLPGVAARPPAVLATLGLATFSLSLWISNTATTAMMAPLAVGLLEALRESRRDAAGRPVELREWPFAAALMLMVAYAASIGGIGTLVGSPPNLIAVQNLREHVPGADLSFFRWMLAMTPLALVMLGVLFLLLVVLAPRTPLTPAAAEEFRRHLAERRRELGPWTRGQANTLLAFGVAATLWIAPGVLALFTPPEHPAALFFQDHVPEAVAALAAGLLLFALPTHLAKGEFTLSWEDGARIDWGTILLFGGGLSLGKLMFDTGVAEALGVGLTDATGLTSLWGLTAVAAAAGILLSEASSNTAAASMLLPVVISLAQGAEVNPVPPALAACLGASFGFMLPVSTPPNAIVYSSGLIPLPRMIRTGLLFDVCGFCLIWVGLRILCPLLGWA